MELYLGKHSFDGNVDYLPWSTLLTHLHSPIEKALKKAWSTLQDEITEAGNDEPLEAPIDLLLNTVKKA